MDNLDFIFPSGQRRPGPPTDNIFKGVHPSLEDLGLYLDKDQNYYIYGGKVAHFW